MDRYEDERLAEGRFAAFSDKKERKLLASDYRRKKMETCMQKVRTASKARGGKDDGARVGVQGCFVVVPILRRAIYINRSGGSTTAVSVCCFFILPNLWRNFLM